MSWRARNYTFVCTSCRQTARGPTYLTPRCPKCSMPMRSIQEEPPRKNRDKQWRTLAEKLDRESGRHRLTNYEEPSPPAPFNPNREGKKKGAWMSLLEVKAAFDALGLTYHGHGWSATDRRTIQGQTFYFRPAVEALIERAKIQAVERALGAPDER